MDAEEVTCGQEMAADAEVPEKLARLMSHVSSNMEVHAKWVGAGPSGAPERDSLMVVAREYQAIADAAIRAAAAMKAMKDIPAAPHDPSRLDRGQQALWMRAKIEMQTQFAHLLVEHAEASKKALVMMEGGAGATDDGRTPNFNVRSFQPPDRAALEQLWGHVFDGDPPWNAPAVMIETKLEVQPELLLVGVVDGVLVGAVMAGFDGVRGWIYHLAVTPSWRRHGFGTQLVRAAEAGLRALGCAKVNIQVRVTNVRVVEFYRELGYAIEERVSMGRRLDG
jgi:ribosomal protein S18 acetylase RimI-like enzyme